ncbi:hypothetical protein IE077_002160 [Cardiosporidium cionae]|uniref:Uncharacterized protein n=1 Tax=Cardiosporidium cionae TaxID=476202 RepID=A0ABQ7J4V3_9APIC|nr:hypothetical protein IE077_002160 [Cardiosporidium cionae]|eukprot:KAF8818147.1 hypothetical protein IE077_002160 [Cardiosporidium cionae]
MIAGLKFFPSLLSVEAALNIHTAVPDVFVKLIDDNIWIDARQAMPLRTVSPVCDSSSGPFCHHLSFKANIIDSIGSVLELSRLEKDKNHEQKASEEFSYSVVHRFPIQMSMAAVPKTEQNLPVPVVFAASNYSNITNFFIEDVGLKYTSLPLNTRANAPLHTVDSPYIPEGRLLDYGLGDITVNYQLLQSLASSIESFCFYVGGLGYVWDFSPPSLSKDATLPENNSSNDSSHDSISPSKSDKSFGATNTFPGWEIKSYVLEFSAFPQVSESKKIPSDYRGQLPENIQLRWSNFWERTVYSKTLLTSQPEDGEKNLPILDKTTRLVDKKSLCSMPSSLPSHISPIFRDTRLYVDTIDPMTRTKLTFNSECSMEQDSTDFSSDSLNNASLYNPYMRRRVVNYHLQKIEHFVALHTLEGDIKFLSPVVIASLWITLYPNSERGANPENTQMNLAGNNQCSGFRVVGKRRGIMKWVASVPFALLEASASQPPLERTLEGEMTTENGVVLVDVMKFTAFSPYFRIDSLEFVYICGKGYAQRIQKKLYMAAIELNVAKKVTLESTKNHNSLNGVGGRERVDDVTSRMFTINKYDPLSTVGLLERSASIQESLYFFGDFGPFSNALFNATKKISYFSNNPNSGLMVAPTPAQKKRKNETDSKNVDMAALQNNSVVDDEEEGPLYIGVVSRLHPGRKLGSVNIEDTLIDSSDTGFEFGEANILKDLYARSSARESLMESGDRIKRFYWKSHGDHRLSADRMGFYLQEIPMEAPVLSLADIHSRNLILSQKPSIDTEAIHLHLLNPEDVSNRKLGATLHSDDFFSVYYKLLDKIFSALRKPIVEILYIILDEGNSKQIFYRNRKKPGTSSQVVSIDESTTDSVNTDSGINPMNTLDKLPQLDKKDKIEDKSSSKVDAMSKSQEKHQQEKMEETYILDLSKAPNFELTEPQRILLQMGMHPLENRQNFHRKVETSTLKRNRR